jgi:hypothetical protein
VKKTVALFLFVSALAGPALAQDPYPTTTPAARPARLGAGVILGLPFGDWSEAVSLSIGGLVDFDYVLTPAISLTGRTGYIHHIDDTEGFSFATIPIWAGGKYYFNPLEARTRFFAMAELALNLSLATVEFAGMSESDTELDLGLNLGGGVELGALSVRVHLSMLDLGHAGDSLELFGSVAYYFLSF